MTRSAAAAPDGIVVQGPVSRSDSVRVRLSHAAWRPGLETFFTHSIPFAESTGLELAARLVQVLRFLAAGSDAAPLPVLEVGAGMGMLSLHLLDLLKEKDPDLYRRVVVHLTDGDPSILAQVDLLGVLRDHASRVRFAPLDLRRLGVLPCRPAMIYSAFVWDSLPARHIEAGDGEIREVLVRTSVAPGASLIDTTVFPPAVLNAAEIARLLGSDDQPRLGALSRELVPLLREEFVAAPLGGGGAPLSPQERRAIERLAGPWTGGRTPVRFNYSQAAADAWSGLLAGAAPEACVVIHDFGFETPTDVPSSMLTRSYGGTSCHPVCFHHLDLTAGAGANASLRGPGREGESQTRVWYRGSRTAAFTALGSKFLNSAERRVGGAVRAIAEYDGPPERFAQAVRDAHGRLAPVQRRSYTLQLITAWEFLARGQVDAALAWARRSLRDYGSVAADSCLVLAVAHRQRGDLHAAERAAREALRIAPGYPEANAELSLILYKGGRRSEAAAVAEAALPGQRGVAIWALVALVVTNQLDQQKPGAATSAVRSLARTAREHPGLVPSFVLRDVHGPDNAFDR